MRVESPAVWLSAAAAQLGRDGAVPCRIGLLSLCSWKDGESRVAGGRCLVLWRHLLAEHTTFTAGYRAWGYCVMDRVMFWLQEVKTDMVADVLLLFS